MIASLGDIVWNTSTVQTVFLTTRGTTAVLENYWPTTDFVSWSSVAGPETWDFAKPLPKWWRWFDVFRTHSKPLMLRKSQATESVRLHRLHRQQERFPLKQRLLQKRRVFVQSLVA